MLKIENIYLSRLRNEAHVSFFKLFRDGVNEVGAEKLKIAPLFQEWTLCFADEERATRRITKSLFTDEIDAADKRRNCAFRGIADFNKILATYYFEPQKRDAAQNLQIIFDTYGNIARQPVKGKTAAMDHFIRKIGDEHYAADVKLVGIGDWLGELAAANAEVFRLTQLRYAEAAERPKVSMANARIAVDAAYQAIVRHINALMEIEDSELYQNYIRRLNVVIASFNR